MKDEKDAQRRRREAARGMQQIGPAKGHGQTDGRQDDLEQINLPEATKLFHVLARTGRCEIDHLPEILVEIERREKGRLTRQH